MFLHGKFAFGHVAGASSPIFTYFSKWILAAFIISFYYFFSGGGGGGVVVVEICIRNSSSVLLDISGIDFSWICCHVTRAGRVFVIFINFKFWWSDLISFIGRKVWNLLYLIKFWYSVCVINNAFDNAASAAADARASSEYLAFSLMN